MAKTFKEIAVIWTAEKRTLVKPSTMSAYRQTLRKHLLPAFGTLSALTENDVQRFVRQKLQDGMGNKSVRDVLMVLRMVVKYGAKQGWMVYTPWDIQYPRTEKKEIQVLSVTDHRKLLQYVRTHYSHRNLGIYICLTMGLRIGEICALRWSDIDTKAGTLSVERTIERIGIEAGGERRTAVVIGSPKTKTSRRHIPLPSQLRILVAPIKRVVSPDSYVITGALVPEEPNTYRQFYLRLLKQLDLPRLNFHALRHSFATRCIESDCDYKTVSALLGHSSVSTTLNLYVHPGLKQKQRCIAKVFKLLS